MYTQKSRVRQLDSPGSKDSPAKAMPDRKTSMSVNKSVTNKDDSNSQPRDQTDTALDMTMEAVKNRTYLN